jgi:NADH/NAD ratio-sensing transcriptional regulator Rex
MSFLDRKNWAEDICRLFMKCEAEMEVNVSEKAKKETLTLLEGGVKIEECFSPVKLEVWKMLQMSHVEFLNSVWCKKLQTG